MKALSSTSLLPPCVWRLLPAKGRPAPCTRVGMPTLTSASSPSPRPALCPAGPGPGAEEPGPRAAEGPARGGLYILRCDRQRPQHQNMAPVPPGSGAWFQLSRWVSGLTDTFQNGLSGSHQTLVLIARILTAARCRGRAKDRVSRGLLSFHCCHVRPFMTPWTAACPAPLSSTICQSSPAVKKAGPG